MCRIFTSSHYLSLAFIFSHCDFILFFFNAPATTEIYTLSLHDALPICVRARRFFRRSRARPLRTATARRTPSRTRSEEHTSELQSRGHLVCRLLLEKKKKDVDASNYASHKNVV